MESEQGEVSCSYLLQDKHADKVEENGRHDARQEWGEEPRSNCKGGEERKK